MGSPHPLYPYRTPRPPQRTNRLPRTHRTLAADCRPQERTHAAGLLRCKQARQAALRWPLRREAPPVEADVKGEGAGARADGADEGARAASDQEQGADVTQDTGSNASAGDEDGAGDATQDVAGVGSVPEALVASK